MEGLFRRGSGVEAVLNGLSVHVRGSDGVENRWVIIDLSVCASIH